MDAVKRYILEAGGAKGLGEEIQGDGAEECGGGSGGEVVDM